MLLKLDFRCFLALVRLCLKFTVVLYAIIRQVVVVLNFTQFSAKKSNPLSDVNVVSGEKRNLG